MRRTLVTLHRLFGLTLAVFLFIAGVTGALIAWDHELDEWLNPGFFRAPTTAQPYSTLELADRIERADPRLRVNYLPLALEPGRTLQLGVQPRIDPKTGEPFALGFEEMAIDPASGDVLGARTGGKFALDRAHIMSFLYRLHYTLHLPLFGTFDSGVILMGIVAIAWVIDCFIALIVSFPNRRIWKRSFQFRLRQGGSKLNFDLHRSGGVWTWVLLLALSITAVSMNLGDEVMRPIVSVFSDLAPDPFGAPDRSLPERAIAPRLDRETALSRGIALARERGIDAPPGGMFYSADKRMYGVGFFEPGHEHADGDLGNPWFYLDADDGSLRTATIPGEGTAGDVFMQLQFPLHSGRFFGITGRVIVTLLGVAVATLSATGVVIWARRRRRRGRGTADRDAEPKPFAELPVELSSGS